ncbi:MAG: VOC family protein [Halieaceae bacterium]|jgi:catechol 2,3-dioxygenase-like lactoylglutathione lyase family enzyme|nr:VOC family protein [Halieaceae bacterium]
MFSHVTIGSNDANKAAEFYDAVLGTLGIPCLFNVEGAVAYGEATGPKTFILKPFDGGSPAPGNGGHVAYLAETRTQVDAFYAAALDHGGTDEGPPGLRPHYHPNYYGAYVRDPEGNKIQAVCHSRGA